jgi:hypothetical protein
MLFGRLEELWEVLIIEGLVERKRVNMAFRGDFRTSSCLRIQAFQIPCKPR